jgi:putative Mg2+ transporter-C (MgtC) family protein
MDSIIITSDTLTVAFRLGLATLLGAAVGLNREMSLKPAGIRTHALVALGAALATHIGLQLAQPGVGDTAAPGRIIQGIVAGIGFIGGGAILHRREGASVEGLTTAASIWVVAATGVAAGAGLWRAAVLTVMFSLILLAIGRVERVVRRFGTGADEED